MWTEGVLLVLTHPHMNIALVGARSRRSWLRASEVSRVKWRGASCSWPTSWGPTGRMGNHGEPWGTMGKMLGHVVPKLAVYLSNLTKIVLKKQSSVANRNHLLLHIDSQCWPKIGSCEKLQQQHQEWESFNQLLHLGQGISNWFESVAEESRSGPLTLLLQDDAGKPDQSAEQVPQRQKPGRVRWSLSQLVAGTEVTGDTARPGSESSPYVGLAGHLRCNVKLFNSFEHVETYVCLPSPVLVQASPQSATCWKEVMRRNPSPDLSLPSRFKLLTHKHTKHLVLCL